MIPLIVIAIICFFGFAAIVTIVSNKSKLKEMNAAVEEFDNMSFGSEQEQREAFKNCYNKLVKIKRGINSDKKSLEEANDIIHAFTVNYKK